MRLVFAFSLVAILVGGKFSRPCLSFLRPCLAFSRLSSHFFAFMDGPGPMEEARNGLEGGADMSGASGGMDIRPQRPSYATRYGPAYAHLHAWRQRSGPAPPRLAPDRFRDIVALVREYQALTDSGARRAFRETRINTLPPAERKKFWYLFFRDVERNRGRAAFERQKRRFPAKLRNAAYMSNVPQRQVLHLSPDAVAYLSVVTSPFINPSNMPGHRVKIPTVDSDPERNSACVCMRSYRTFVVPAGGVLNGEPIVFLSSPRPNFVTGGLPLLTNLDFLPGVTPTPANTLSQFAGGIARKYPIAFYAQLNAANTAPRSRVVGHGLKIWVQPPVALAQQGAGQITSYVCDTQRFLKALGERSLDSGIFADPPTAPLMLPMYWLQYGCMYQDYLASFGSSLALAAEESTTNPMYNVRDATKGVTMRYHPRGVETQFQSTQSTNLSMFHFSEMQRAGQQLIPPQCMDRGTFQGTTPQAYNVAYCGGAIPPGPPFNPPTDIAAGPLFTAITPHGGTWPASIPTDLALDFILANGHLLQDANTAAITYAQGPESPAMDALTGSELLVCSLANCPAGSTITVQQVWHYECETSADSVLNMDASPQVVDAGWNNVLAIMNVKNVFPLIVDGHSFWDDIGDAFTSAGNWIVGAYDTATGWVNRAISGAEHAVEAAAPFVEKALPWIELGASLL